MTFAFPVRTPSAMVCELVIERADGDFTNVRSVQVAKQIYQRNIWEDPSVNLAVDAKRSLSSAGPN